MYEHPASEFIAGFVGISNVLERPDSRGTVGRFMVRPEKIRMLGAGEEPAQGVAVEEGTIHDVVYVGAVTRYHVELDAGGELTVVSQNLESGFREVLERQGSRVRLCWRPEHVFEIETGSKWRLIDERTQMGTEGSRCAGHRVPVRHGRRLWQR